ncbi:MAG: VCBS domain-containing protein [Burkholderiales bacterium]
MAVSPVSFSKTPQAKDDLFANSVTEDSLAAILDVMGNDLGGAAKSLYSLDNGDKNTDLLAKDTARTSAASGDFSAKGAKIWITNDGKVGYDAGALSAQLQSLAVGEYFEDSFTYAIQLGNGTISIATAVVRIVGQNDGPQITSVAQTGAVKEDQITSISGQVTASDVDHGDHQHYALSGGGSGTYGSLSVNATSGAWTYVLNNGATNVQALAQGERHVESFTVRVTDDYGAFADQAVKVTVTGTNDGPQITSGDQSGAVQEDQTLGATGQVTATDVDNGDHQHYAVQGNAAGGYGALAVNADTGVWTYTLANTGAGVQALAQGESHTEIFTVRVSDDFGATADQVVKVLVTGTNDGPVAVADTAAGTENQTLVLDVLANDADVDNGHSFTLQNVSVPSGNGAVSITNNQLVFNPGSDFDHLNVGQTATVEVAYDMSDEHGAASSSMVTLTITGTNDGPVAVADTAAGSENQMVVVDVLGNDTDVDDGHILTLQNASVAAANGAVSIADNKLVFNPGADFDHLNVGQSAAVQVSYTMSDEHGALSLSTLAVDVSGTNDAPTVAGGLSGETNEDAAPISFNLLAGAADVDDGSVLGVSTLTEANGKGGWVLDGNVITINPDYFGDALNDGEFENLNFNYQVKDEHGALVAQALNVRVEGITDAPSLSVSTSAGEHVNEVMLSITSQPARNERVGLTFSDVPAGAHIYNAAGQDVTAGLPSYIGTREFKLVLAADTDEFDDLSVIVTGYRDNGSVIGSTVQSIDLAYDVVATIGELNFSSNNQNIWGDFPGIIDFHEYIPFVGGTPMVWDAQTETWTDVASDYWRSGKFGLVDVQLDTNKIVAVAQDQAKGTLDAAKTVFDTTAFVIDGAVQGAFNAAKQTFAAAENTFWYVARGVDQAVRDVFKAAQDAYGWAQGVYNDAWHAFNVVATGAYNFAAQAHSDFMNYYNSFHPDWRWLNDIPKGVADGIWATAQWAYGEANKAWSSVKTWFDNTATAIYNEAVRVYNEAAGAIEQAAINTFNTAKVEFAKAEKIYNDAKAWVLAEAQKVYDGVQKGINDILIAIGSKVDYNSKLTVEAEVFAKAGLQVDVVLDLGSVDTSIDYQLTSTTQYNKTTDMLAITPLMANMTTGESIAFDTISPNAKFYVALHYDAGADFDVSVDGHLRVEGTTLYDLTPNSNAPVNLGQTISPKTAVADIQSLLTDAGLGALSLGGDLDVGKLVLVDFDSSKLEPFEVPFVGTLTEDVVSITLTFPTVTTEGTEAAFSPTQYEEGGFIALDFSEITSAVLNLVNARLDYSPELREKIPGLGSLYDTQNFDQLVDQALKVFMGTLLDVLDGQSEEVPIFMIDATDATSSSFVLANLWPDSTMTSTLDGKTASLGFYAAYGESAPVVHINFDVDQAVAFVVNEIVKAAINVATQGSATSVLAAIPTINPLDLTLGLDTILKVMQLDQGSRELITKFFDLNLNFQAADVDAHATTKFSQEFTLSVDDMSYLVTLEDGTQQAFSANGAGQLLITDASSHDLNGDGSVDYTMDIVPTAMFSNDTELGFGVGYTLDFMKGSLGASVNLNLGALLDIDADWLGVEIPLVDVALGPLLRVQGDLDVLDVDIFEARFDLDIGSDSFASAVDIDLMGVNTVPA